jgi:hypothetical protein
MIIRYRLQNIWYVYFVENKQRKTYNLVQVIFLLINILIVHLFQILARARARGDGLVE